MVDFQKAIKKVESGQSEEGIQEIKNNLKYANHEEKYNIALLFYDWGFHEDAIRIVEELLTYYPDEGQLIVLFAELMIDMNEDERAIGILSEIGEDDPFFIQAQILSADLYQSQALDEVAEQKLLQAKRISPNEPLIDFGLGEFYFNKGDYKKSILYYQTVIQQQDMVGEVNLHLRLAEALSLTGSFEESLDHYGEGLKEKDDIDALFGFGFTAYQLEQYKTAISKWEKLKEIDPQYTSLYPYLAKAYEQEGALEEGLEVIKEGLRFDEYNSELFYLGGELTIKLGNNKEAEEMFRQALAIDPEHSQAAEKLVRVYFKENRYEDAVELLTEIQRFSGENPKAHWDLGYSKKELELYEEALEHYRSAFDTYQDNPQFLEEFGFFLLEEGQRNDALSMFQKLLQLEPARTDIEDVIYQLEAE